MDFFENEERVYAMLVMGRQRQLGGRFSFLIDKPIKNDAFIILVVFVEYHLNLHLVMIHFPETAFFEVPFRIRFYRFCL